MEWENNIFAPFFLTKRGHFTNFVLFVVMPLLSWSLTLHLNSLFKWINQTEFENSGYISISLKINSHYALSLYQNLRQLQLGKSTYNLEASHTIDVTVKLTPTGYILKTLDFSWRILFSIIGSLSRKHMC